jgi:hypothetical protein
MADETKTPPQIAVLMLGKIGVRQDDGTIERVVIQRAGRRYGNGRVLNGRYQLQVRRHVETIKDRRSGPQLIRRSRFQEGVAAWKAMTEEERKPWKTRANRQSRTGYNLFLSEWMRGINPSS